MERGMEGLVTGGGFARNELDILMSQTCFVSKRNMSQKIGKNKVLV
jgi:hypothetical protein